MREKMQSRSVNDDEQKMVEGRLQVKEQEMRRGSGDEGRRSEGEGRGRRERHFHSVAPLVAVLFHLDTLARVASSSPLFSSHSQRLLALSLADASPSRLVLPSSTLTRSSLP